MVVDMHTHLRDFKQFEKETIAQGLYVALGSGVEGVFDMPNTNPSVTSRENVEARLRLAKDSGIEGVFYGTYIGATSDPEQLRQAVKTYRDFFPRVVGFKLYAGESVGDLAVKNLADQRIVYKTLAEEGYEGVLVVHCEKESEMERNLFTPLFPVTHCLARPEKAEIESVIDQIALAKSTKFHGKLHIAHITTPKAVDLVQEAREIGLDISCAVCPHHLIYDQTKMEQERGILWKMNPPLRASGTNETMLRYLKQGKIDLIETDHAPHTWDEKTNGFMSGLPALPWWPLFKEFLRSKNFSEKEIEKVTRENVLERFGIDIPKSRREIIDHREVYAFNPFESLEKKLNWKI